MDFEIKILLSKWKSTKILIILIIRKYLLRGYPLRGGRRHIKLMVLLYQIGQIKKLVVLLYWMYSCKIAKSWWGYSTNSTINSTIPATPRHYLTFIVGTDYSVLAVSQQHRPIGAVWLCPNSPECRCNIRVSPTWVR